jgi:hypothetical protein
MSQEWQAKRQQLLDGDEVQVLTFPVLKSMHEQALAFAKERDCPEEEALRLILCHGLAYLRGEATLRRVERADTPERALEEFQETTRQMMEEASQAAALKFLAYRLSEDNQVMEMHDNAMKNTVLMQQNRMNIYREDEEKLKSRIRELEAENQKMRVLLPQPGESPVRPAKPRRLFGFLKR